MTYVLDASAIPRFLDGESGVDRVSEILGDHISGLNAIVMSAVHWGEVTGIFYKRHGVAGATPHLTRLQSLKLTIIPVTDQRAQRSALIKYQHKIPYIDACAVELAGDSPNYVVITADYDMKPAEQFVSVEILPAKRPR